MFDYLILILGLICAGLGGELFVRGAVGLAHWARVPAGIIGATIAAFATSSPELAVSVGASLEGKPQIALGDALGSNVANIALVLGIGLVISKLKASRSGINRDFPVAALAPLLTGILILDGELSRIDGFIMLAVFLGWLIAVVFEVRRSRSSVEEVLGERNRTLILLSLIGGLGLLIAAGRLIVSGAKTIALSYGLEEFVVGATVVAIGTSIPELATVVISKLRGHEEIGLGTIFGSNIFNNFWIVSVATLISPMQNLPLRELAVGLGFGLVTVLLTFPGRDGVIGRSRGAILLVLYAAYVTTILSG
ncbi:MAG TPA: calcium/sodium antiporter [Pyrinomonadaceae bacterium]|nr:calcium/sodium antiporter [Pyrinomonadaceae bacterium]